MRSYEVVVGGRLLGLLVPGLPAATPDSPSVKMLEDAMRRQQRAIGHAPEKRAEHADLKASSIEKAHLEYPETCAATAFIRSHDLNIPRAKNGPSLSLEAKWCARSRPGWWRRYGSRCGPSSRSTRSEAADSGGTTWQSSCTVPTDRRAIGPRMVWSVSRRPFAGCATGR